MSPWDYDMLRAYEKRIKALEVAPVDPGEGVVTPSSSGPPYTDAERAMGAAFLATMDKSTADGISMGRAVRAAIEGSAQGEIDARRVPGLIRVEGSIGSTLYVGTDYRVAEIREHHEPSGIEGEPPTVTTVIRFDPILAFLDRVGGEGLDVATVAEFLHDLDGAQHYTTHEYGYDGDDIEGVSCATGVEGHMDDAADLLARLMRRSRNDERP